MKQIMESKRQSQYMSQLWRLVTTIPRIYFSGLFDVPDYLDKYPDLNGKPLNAYIHLIRHGIRHSSFLSQDPAAASLLPELIQKRIGPWRARKLAANYRGPDDSSASFSSEYARSNFLCAKAYLEGRFKDALNVLNDTSSTFRLKFCHSMLRGPYLLDDIAPFMSGIRDVFLSGEWDNSIDGLKFYYDVTMAFGESLPDQAILLERIIKCVQQQNDSSGFYLGILPTAAAPDQVRMKAAYGDYAIFQDIAAYNAITPLAAKTLSRAKQGWDVRRADGRKCVGVCVPPPEIWITNDRFGETVRQVFKGLIAQLDDTVDIMPIIFPYVRDVSRMKFPCERVISYHTYAQNRPNILHYKETSFKGECSFDETGYSGAALSAQSAVPSSLKAVPLSDKVVKYKQRHMSGALSKYTQPKIDDQKPLDDGFILIVLQSQDDSVGRWHNISPIEMIKTCSEFARDKNLRVVMKPHPKEKSRYFMQQLESLADIYESLTISNQPIEALLPASRFIVTANSGVGFEALLYETPVITTAYSEYQPASLYAENIEGLTIGLVRALHQTSVPNDEGGKHNHWINHYCQHALWDGASERPKNHILDEFISKI